MPELQPQPIGKPVGTYQLTAAWILAKASHLKARRRRASPVRVTSYHTLLARFIRLETPWKVWEYPGHTRYLAALFGVARNYAERMIEPSRAHQLPLKHAQTVRALAEVREAEWRQLRLDLDQFIAEKAERNRQATELHLRALRRANGKRTGPG